MSTAFVIEKTWNNLPITHSPVLIYLKRSMSAGHFEIEVEAPYFAEPGPPSGPPGKPFPGLWEYEVVEVFFLGNSDRYLEIEFCPHGHYLVLLLKGCRNMITDKLEIEYKCSIEGNSWKGSARIPVEYLPPGFSKLNAFAIHGSGTNRTYEALYPTPTDKYDSPDFHRLEYFQKQDIAFLPDSATIDWMSTWNE